MATVAPPAILSKPRGCMIVHYGGGGVELMVRESRVRMGDYPRVCPVQLKMCAWDYSPVIVVAILARFNRQAVMTYQSWLDCGEPAGVSLLKQFPRRDEINVHLVTDEIARTFRVPNVLSRKARQVIERLEQHQKGWSREQFAQARAKLDRLYVTAADVWRSAE